MRGFCPGGNRAVSLLVSPLRLEAAGALEAHRQTRRFRHEPLSSKCHCACSHRALPLLVKVLTRLKNLFDHQDRLRGKHMAFHTVAKTTDIQPGTMKAV